MTDPLELKCYRLAARYAVRRAKRRHACMKSAQRWLVRVTAELAATRA